MSMWEGYPGKWLAAQLEAGAVLALETLRVSVAGERSAHSGVCFPQALLETAFASAGWGADGGYDEPMRLQVHSHGEEHDVRLVSARVFSDAATYPLFTFADVPTTGTVLGSSALEGVLAVLAVTPNESGDRLHGHLWIGRDEREEADLAEAFDTGEWGGWSRPRLLRW